MLCRSVQLELIACFEDALDVLWPFDVVCAFDVVSRYDV